jgi:opacity protein-like surface antigen
MRKSVLIVAAVALALASPLVAADNAPVLGKWESTTETPQRTFQVVFEFTEVDGELKATWSNPRRNGDLKNVTWDGETVKFERDLQAQGQSFRLSYEATVDGNKMTGTMTTPRGDREFTATRDS